MLRSNEARDSGRVHPQIGDDGVNSFEVAPAAVAEADRQPRLLGVPPPCTSVSQLLRLEASYGATQISHKDVPQGVH